MESHKLGFTENMTIWTKRQRGSLEHILSEYFPKELYQKQYLFSSGEQVDFVLKLPDGKLLPIDSKFNFDNYRRSVEAVSDEDKKYFRKKWNRIYTIKID